ncbi:MAG: DUF2283 domain-containing protein [Chloroflexi bacterium]|nr:DUF2283 domain-containing protein [Chloroflexota bacterium]
MIFREGPVVESDEIREGIIIDYGKDGRIVSVEVLDASEHILDPRTMTYEVRGAA